MLKVHKLFQGGDSENVGNSNVWKANRRVVKDLVDPPKLNQNPRLAAGQTDRQSAKVWVTNNMKEIGNRGRRIIKKEDWLKSVWKKEVDPYTPSPLHAATWMPLPNSYKDHRVFFPGDGKMGVFWLGGHELHLLHWVNIGNKIMAYTHYYWPHYYLDSSLDRSLHLL